MGGAEQPSLKHARDRREAADFLILHAVLSVKRSPKIPELNESPNRRVAGKKGIREFAILRQFPVTTGRQNGSPSQIDSKDRLETTNLQKNFSSQLPSLEL